MSKWLGIGSTVLALIDDFITTDEERQQLKSELLKVENERHKNELDLRTRILDLQSQVVNAQQQVIVAEAKGESRLQRNWRPITMLTFLTLIVLDSFGVLAFRLSEQAWELLQLGIGGYVIGRTVEKAAPQIKQSIQNLGNKNG
ncbi:hypothetical protein N473_06995 [Pseudoalteromonas luteoviolacea CPMOR-1]|uniref:Holin n=1 Tax=Pseudoalteromonas luteoviolacea CPMOR-1 TaxID=1365248 RepID=A0A167H4A0_9GAMM|nr:3TM-type holin [Pseudoalteromonas luteoviolacea]KZN57615.1 hypothetical protein N473_06995 [Pseudoalteromonas luteoviolacea CPMOR-1]